MNRYRLVLWLCVAACAAANTASADIIGARATPRQVNLVGTGSNLVSVNWQVSTTPLHRSGVSSTAASIIDPASGTVLTGLRAPLDATGIGPYVLRETLNLDAAMVRSWTDLGLRRVVLERTFADPSTGSFASGSIVLTLSASRLQSSRDSAPAELSIVSLRVEFDSGNNTKVMAAGETLRALLTVQFTGSGMFTGRWQIADPESSDGLPLFRTLALVNTNLQASQRSTLPSPALPTERGGKYLVRFCAASRGDGDVTGDAQCPNADLVATATYHVQSRDDGLGVIEHLAPDRQAASELSAFSWQPLPAAAVYQLQIFALDAAETGQSDPPSRGVSIEPRFVAGMLLDRATRTTPLSELTRSKLRAGQRYLWRVTAHDGAGRMIGASAEASFVYQPGG